MIRIFKLLFLLVISQVAFAQAPSNYTNINGRYRWIAGMFDSTFHIPKGTNPSLRTGGSTNAGALFYKTGDSSLYIYTGTQWLKQAGTAGFVPYSGATDTLDMGQFGLKTKFVQFDTSTRAVTDRVLQWSNDNGTLAFGMTNGSTITQNVGLQQFARVKNVQGSQINKGQVVYLYGASGDRAAVKLADNRADSTSSKTLGIAIENIPINGEGFVGTFGTMSGLNLSAYTPGDQLYLDSIPGGLTKTKPQAPYHMVFIGVVERANAGNGLLFTNVQNGYELEELHNVKITSPVNNKAVLIYDSINRLWVDTTVAGAGLAVTSVATNTGTGITGGTITTTGTLAIDTLLISTRAWRQKGIDSVAALLGASVSGTTNYIPKFTSSSAIGNSTMLTDANGNIIVSSGQTWGTSAGGLNLSSVSDDGYVTTYYDNKNLTLGAGVTSKNRIVIEGQAGGNNINFNVFGSERMRITGGGNVGIGNTSAISRLQVTGLSASPNNTIFATTSDFALSSTGSLIRIGHVASTGNTTAIIQNLTTGGTASGNISFPEGSVGIGTTSPNQKLTIADAAYPIIGFNVGSTPQGYIGSLNAGGLAINSQVAQPIIFYTNDTERMRIDASGNLGLGTSSPQSDATYGGLTINGTNGSILTFRAGNSNSARIYTTGVDNINIDGNGSASTNIIFRTGTGSTERMRITSGGNVGIGTTSPRAVSGFTTLALNNATNGGLIDFLNNGTLVGQIFNNSTSFDIGSITSVPLVFRTGDGERMRITSGGNVGIGTSSPNFAASGRTVLDVNGSSNSMLCLSVAGTAGSYLYQASGNLNISNEVSGNIISYTGGSEVMRITSGGNVGIGTTNPTSKLAMVIANSGTNVSGLDITNNVNASFNVSLRTDITQITAGGTGNMVFANTSERMRITSGGNVGIGTTSPSGNFDIFSSSNVYQNISTNGTNQSAVLSLYNSTATGDGAAIGYNVAMRFGTITGLNAAGFTERMRITSGGELLVNTTSDAGDYKLQVNGNAIIGGSGNPTLTINGTDGAYTGQLYINAAGAGSSKIIANGGSNELIFETNNTPRLTVNSNGIKTAAPSGGTAKPWKLGAKVATSVTLDTGNYIEVEIDGVTYKLAIVNPS